ncbi:hypothetical protein V8F20_003919 [Naviculisporaceae sp. PSN 640]
MASFDRLPNEILLQIFEYLTPPEFELNEELNFYAHDIFDRKYMHDEQWSFFLEPRAALHALSTRTNKRISSLALPLLWKNVVFVNTIHILNFVETLVKHPERGRWVKQITWALSTPIEVEDERMDLGFEAFVRTTLPALLIENANSSSNLYSYYAGPLRRVSNELPRRLGRFNAGRQGAIGCLILSLTPNLVTLNVSGFQDWMDHFRNWPILDPFLWFLEGRAGDWYSDTIQALFSREVCRLERDQLTGEMVGMTFPPPRLQLIVKSCRSPTALDPERGQMGDDKELDLDFVTERLRLRPTEKISKLIRLSSQLTDTLGIPIDNRLRLENAEFLAPSSIVRAASVETLQAIRKYLGLCETLAPRTFEIYQWIKTLQELGAEPGIPISSRIQLEILDDKSRDFQDWLIRLYACAADRIPSCYQHSISTALIDLLELGVDPVENPPRPGVTDLTVFHPEMAWLAIGETRFLTGGTMGRCIAHQFPNLQVLDLSIRIYIGNRKTIFHRFTPAAFENLVELTITMEALWGPVTTVLQMIGGDMELRDDDTSLAALKLRDQVWAMRAKAIERLPPLIKTLRILDWFADYYHDCPEDHEAADFEQARREALAAAAGTTQSSPPPPTPENTYDPAAATPFYDYPEVRSPYPGEDRGRHAPSFGIRPPSPAPNPFRHARTVENDLSKFTERYIRALEHGLIKLFLEAPPFWSKPLMKVRRPQLKTLEFVYTMQSELSDLQPEDVPAAMRSDNLWVQWYRDVEANESSLLLGYRGVAEELLKMGVKFDLGEEYPGQRPGLMGPLGQNVGGCDWLHSPGEELEFPDNLFGDGDDDSYEPEPEEQEDDLATDLIDITEGEYQEPVDDEDLADGDEDWMNGEGELGGWDDAYGDMGDEEGTTDYDRYETRVYEDAMYFDEQIEGEDYGDGYEDGGYDDGYH